MCRGCSEDPTRAASCRRSRGELLRGVYLFERLRPELLERMVDAMREVGGEAGQWLCLHGAPADRFYLVLEGEVALLRSSAEGEEIIVAIVGRGELFGEELVFQEAPRHALSVRALGPCRLAAFDHRELRAVVEEQPELLFQLLQTLERRNALLLDELERVTIQSASERLMTFLESQSRSGAPLPLRIPKRVLASRLAIRPETLSRILGQLKACHRLREVDGCLLPTSTGDASDGPCESCPARLWGCPGPRAVPATVTAAAGTPQQRRTTAS